jgi:serine/threonine protein kinase
MADYDAAARALADRYRFEREVGMGGMATVFLATDLRHSRDVAVKLLKPELSSAIGTERFLREIRITARLNHPHILPLIDSGEADALLFYVTPYVAGGSLRQRLVRESRLSVETTIEIVRQVGSALDYAHRENIVHRDVKPENILFSEGHAIVADFGIGRAISSAGAENLTRSGFPLGTPGYMSPEQAAGRLDADGATDVFGLGCATYEMLVGETPEFWPTDESRRVGRFLDASDQHRERLDTLPGRVEQALVGALAIRPSDRFATAAAFADALDTAHSERPRYSNTQVDALLERAAAIDATADDDDTNLTIGAVEQAAAQVGIRPTHVRQAAAEVVGPRSASPPQRYQPRPETFVVQERKIAIERELQGEIGSDRFEALVTTIHNALGLWGHASIMGRTLTWSPAAQGSSGRNILVTVTPREGRTVLHIEERLDVAGGKPYLIPPAAALGGLFVLGTVAALGAPDGAALVPALFGAGGSAWLAERGLTFNTAMDRQPELDRLADTLVDLLEPGT